MANTVRKIDYYALTVPDKAGEGHRILSALAEAGVNLLAVVGFPLGEGKAQIDLVPEDATAFAQAAERMKLRTRKAKQAFLVQGDDRVGVVSEVLGKLASQKIQLTAAQALAAGAGRWAMIFWVKPGSVEKAAKALGV
jgi:predicted amino acid-binding ACT domain protein